MGLVITNGKIVGSKGIRQEDIRIENDHIVKIGLNIAKEDDEIIDANGSYIMPGGIDVHTHFDADAGGLVADSFYTGTRAALMGGTTTIVDFAEQVRGTTLKGALDEWNKKTKDKCFTDFAYHMTISDWNKDTEKEMEAMIEEGITSFKMFFAYEDLQVDDTTIYEALKKSKELGALMSFHCENGSIIDKLREEAVENGNIEPLYHAKTRPASMEREAISRLTSIAGILDVPVYIVHLSTKEGLEEIRYAREKGQKIYIETCPHYLLLNKDYYISKGEDRFEGAKYVLSPPLRDVASQKALWEGIVDNEIEVIATDHCAFNYKGQKDLGADDFTKIPNGGPGVENRVKLMYTYGVRENKFGMEKLVEILAENPSKIFGMYPQKGVIEEGSHADILIFNPHVKSTIRAEDQVQNVDYNLYEGFTQYGKFEYIFLRGQLVAKDEKLIKTEPTGSYIKRNTVIRSL